ncbi:MAG: SH3 domain-containing protein [Thermomicrobiales bacterium]
MIPTLIPLEGTAFLQASVNCRIGPGTSYSILGVVNGNARIPLRGGLQNGWYPVVCFGQDGWIMGNYIAVQSPTPTATATATLPSTGSRGDHRAGELPNRHQHNHAGHYGGGKWRHLATARGNPGQLDAGDLRRSGRLDQQPLPLQRVLLIFKR